MNLQKNWYSIYNKTKLNRTICIFYGMYCVCSNGSIRSLMATTGGAWIIPSFQIWGYVLYVEHISCVIMNCGQHQWAILSLFSIALEDLLEENITKKLLSLSLDLFFKFLLFLVTFLIFFSIAVLSPYFLLVGLLLEYMALFQSRELVKV